MRTALQRDKAVYSCMATKTDLMYCARRHTIPAPDSLSPVLLPQIIEARTGLSRWMMRTRGNWQNGATTHFAPAFAGAKSGNAAVKCDVFKQIVCEDGDCDVRKSVKCKEICAMNGYDLTLDTNLVNCDPELCAGEYGTFACREVAMMQ